MPKRKYYQLSAKDKDKIQIYLYIDEDGNYCCTECSKKGKNSTRLSSEHFLKDHEDLLLQMNICTADVQTNDIRSFGTITNVYNSINCNASEFIILSGSSFLTIESDEFHY